MSILLDVVETLEQFKLKFNEVQAKEQEFDSFVKSIKATQEIHTCSETLQFLIQKYRIAAEGN